MRILVAGAGATGGYFGARLAAAGRDVTFLVRPERAEQLRRDGLQIVSPLGDLHLAPQLVTAAQLQPDYDAIVLAVKAYALSAAIDDLAPAVAGERTAIVPFLNGMRHIDVLAERFGAALLGGVCMVSTQLDERGRIVQLSGMQELVYGELDGTASPRLTALHAALSGAGFEARASSHIRLEMWGKWIGLATLGAMTCLLRGNVGEIAAEPGGTEVVHALLSEAAAVAAAAGFAPPPEVLERMRAQLTAPGSALASSMYRDLQQGRHVEVDQIIGDLLDRARRLGVATPLLAAAFVALRVYDARVGARSAAPAAVA